MTFVLHDRIKTDLRWRVPGTKRVFTVTWLLQECRHLLYAVKNYGLRQEGHGSNRLYPPGYQKNPFLVHVGAMKPMLVPENSDAYDDLYYPPYEVVSEQALRDAIKSLQDMQARHAETNRVQIRDI